MWKLLLVFSGFASANPQFPGWVDKLLAHDEAASMEAGRKIAGVYVNGSILQEESLGKKVQSGLTDSRAHVRLSLCTWLGKVSFFPETIADALAARALDPKETTAIREAALHAIAKKDLDAKKIALLRRVLEEESAEESLIAKARELLGKALPRFDAKSIIPVIELLSSESECARTAALEILFTKARQSPTYYPQLVEGLALLPEAEAQEVISRLPDEPMPTTLRGTSQALLSLSKNTNPILSLAAQALIVTWGITEKAKSSPPELTKSSAPCASHVWRARFNFRNKP